MNLLNEKTIPRPEYPRPQFVRQNNWKNLNGEWDFAFDDNNIGLKERWYKKEESIKFDKKIIVPFCFQSKLSGIGDESFHDIVWYRREFILPDNFAYKRILLHFGAVDYSCTVYLNGEFVGTHEGGYIGFNLDISDFIEKKNVLVLRIEDPSTNLEIPRGKQYWEKEARGIFYQRITGIWQTVWLEAISLEYHIKYIKITPFIDKSEIIIECEICGIGDSDLYFFIEIFFNNIKIAEEEIRLDFLGIFGKRKGRKLIKERFGLIHKDFKTNINRFKLRIPIPEKSLYLWNVENPNLYDLSMKVYNKNTMEIYDEVKSYFGMRKISLTQTPVKVNKTIEEKNEFNSFNRQVLLNNKPIYQKLFLIQGYWPDGLYTAPSDEAIKLDVQLVKEFGFNGLRTHQKAFDPRFLYWCDKLGVLVWGEIGNAYLFSTEAQLSLINEFIAEIERDFNHPSIIAWVVLNEGWGVPGAEKDPRKTDFTISLYYLMKSIDSTRLIVDDDGWWHGKTDFCTRHFYFPIDLLPKSYEDEIKSHEKAKPRVYLKPYEYEDEPIIYSEIGGYAYDLLGDINNKWGYGNTLQSSEELFNKVLELLIEFDKRKEWIHGFCYTELYDQFQEINGLLTFNRVPKFKPSKLKEELNKMFY